MTKLFSIFEVVIATFLNTKLCKVLSLWRWACHFRLHEGLWCLHLRDQVFQFSFPFSTAWP